MKPLNWSGQQTTPLSKKIGQRGPTMDERSEGIVSLFFFLSKGRHEGLAHLHGGVTPRPLKLTPLAELMGAPLAVGTTGARL